MKNSNKPHNDPTNFKLPADYFNQLEDDVMIKLITESFPKKSGFSVPSSYFEQVTEPIAQQLFNSRNHFGFVAPEGYFKSTALEASVEKRIKESTPTKVIPLKHFFLKQFAPIAVAASLALIVFFNFDQVETNLNSIATADIEQWIDDDLISLNDSEILEVFADVELDDAEYFNDEEVLDYFTDTNIEALLLDE